jgi:hypothetical protein
MDPDRPSISSHATDAYSADFFDGLYYIYFFLIDLFNFVILIASVADLADLLKSEPQDDFIVALQDTLSNVFSSPTIFSLAYVKTNFFFFISLINSFYLVS